MDKEKGKAQKAPGTARPAGEVKAAKPPGVPPLFRRIDWLTFGATTLLTFIGYFLTLAPDLTLEDSGELAVASYYAGVPHPPGYPVWTLYTWLFTVLIPFSNIAWRVAISSAVAAAFSCGLVALMVSRGSSMILEGIESLKKIDRRLENWMCIISGFAAGMLLGFNGVMWSQAVIVEVYTLSALSLVGVLCLMLRWIYAPEQRRYLYWAFFLFGVAFTNHQTLIVAAMGIEVAIMAVRPKVGRDFFFGNSVIYLIGLLAKANGHIGALQNNPPLFMIYNLVGISSIIACGWLVAKTGGLLSEWRPVLFCGLLWLLGVAFYLYMPIASMTNPPLNWGYPRTWEGFVHALTRGQYERANPTDIFGNPVHFLRQLWMYGVGAVKEFNFVYLLIGVVPYFFYGRMQKRERGWISGLTAIFVCLAVLLLIILNPLLDRQSQELNRVFFTASHIMIAMSIGYGLTLIAATLLTQYETYRRWGLFGGAIAASIGLYGYADLQMQYPLAKFTALFGLVLAGLAILLFGLFRTRLPLILLLILFAILPTHSILEHWSDNEQRGHRFGYWFGHDMFTPPFGIYPEIPKNSILFGGTDPGRFNPTYMIFCESFISPEDKHDPEFDRRDVPIITQNALADNTYLAYIRAHYMRSAQIDSPFFQDMLGTKLVAPLDRIFTKLGARIEKRRRERGVYPATEIYTPSPEDSQWAFTNYVADASRRLQHDMQFPNEPKQIKQLEDVKIADNRIQVSGQVAVMAINALLTKVIFDHNPDRDFYIEESFPLDWMYPYLSPFGIIMRIHREPLQEMTEEMVQKDHEFWSKYSERLCGNWITYDTTVSELCDFAQRIYLRREFTNFKGDPKFVRDRNAQKAFSKLRSSIAGVYRWRLSQPSNPGEYQRLVKEAEFAFKQAFALCPYSPEAVYRYIDLLANLGRLGDALQVAETAYKFDAQNRDIQKLILQLQQMIQGQSSLIQAQQNLAQLEQQYRTNVSNAQAAFNLVSAYLQIQRTGQALQVLDHLVANPLSDANAVLSVAQVYAQLQQASRLEVALLRLVQMMPSSPEAWYDLAAIQATIGKSNEAVQSLSQSIQLSNHRLKEQPAAKDLRIEASTNAQFSSIRGSPQFQALLAPR